jgi:hypothetical protein
VLAVLYPNERKLLCPTRKSDALVVVDNLLFAFGRQLLGKRKDQARIFLSIRGGFDRCPTHCHVSTKDLCHRFSLLLQKIAEWISFGAVS